MSASVKIGQNYSNHLFKWLWAMDTRALELTFGMLIFLRGVFLICQPDAMSGHQYESFISTMSQLNWAQVCLMAGGFQLAGVVINGNWKRSPWLRFAGATVSAIFYAMLATLYIQSDVYQAITTFGPMAFAMIWTAINIASKQ